ncbi:MAG: hypothetical protein AVDCRST_MAG64-3001, partial [uncultured Phycisphaerae bacterium]
WPVIVHLSPVGVPERTEFQGYSHGIFLPYWVAVTLTAPLPTVLILRRLRRIRQVLRRTAGGRCPDCGYDLRATPGRCPECGAVPINSPAPT